MARLLVIGGGFAGLWAAGAAALGRVRSGEARVSQHAAAKLPARALPLQDVLAGVEDAVAV